MIVPRDTTNLLTSLQVTSLFFCMPAFASSAAQRTLKVITSPHQLLPVDPTPSCSVPALFLPQCVLYLYGLTCAVGPPLWWVQANRGVSCLPAAATLVRLVMLVMVMKLLLLML